ncbi:MAG: ferrous iron transport protein B [Vulcanimicrobiota bacterium]
MGHPASLPKAEERLVVAVGNPNVGKSTLINGLSGADLEIGNWPGTTVERISTQCRLNDRDVALVDLPGAYSLAATTPEEEVTRRELLEASPDLVINVVDAGNLERNLYLTLELAELGLPTVVVLNLVDEARKAGLVVDSSALSEALGIPVVETVANRGLGLELVHQHLCLDCLPSSAAVTYPEPIETVLEGLTGSRWERLAILSEEPRDEAATRLQEQLLGAGIDPFLTVVERRFEAAREIAGRVTRQTAAVRTLTDRLDALILHPLLGLPAFLVSMFLTFRFTFLFSDPWIEFVGVIQGVLAGWVASLGLPELIRSFLAEGLIGGLGTLVSFAPVLFCLYLGMSFLESSGFLARAACLADRVMRGVGLPGRGFIPLLLGFGCNVPAVYATRALEGFSERLRVAMAIPFMACSARLAVFTLFAAVFFPRNGAVVVFGLYLGGLAVGLFTSWLLRRVTPESPTSGVMELPPYRMPTARVVVRQAWLRTLSFVKGAWGMILAAVLVVWLLSSLPPGDMANSLYARLAGVVAYVCAPLGFTDWRLVGALLPGFIAKEVVVGVLGVTYLGSDPAVPLSLTAGLEQMGTGLWTAIIATINAVPALFGLPNFVPEPTDAPNALQAALSHSTTAAGALGYLVFVLLYTPCVATVAAIRQEFGKKWANFSIVYQLTVAYLMALVVYQIARWWL